MIRKFESKDEESVIAIWLKASIIAHPFIGASFWRSKVTAMHEIYLPASSTYVYEDDRAGLLLGFISLVENYIAAIFVDPDAQGAGVGRELMNFAKNRHSQLRLCVFSKNSGAIRFYRKQGFVLSGEREEEHTGELEVVMEFKSDGYLPQGE